MSRSGFASRQSFRRLACGAALVCTAGLATGALLAATQTYGETRNEKLVAPVTAHVEPAIAGPASFADIVRKVKPAVIAIRARTIEDSSEFVGNGRDFGRRERPRVTTSQGSGFFISPDGYAVTNNHVLNGSDHVEVHMDDGRVLRADVIGTDPASDLALIRAERTDGDFPYLHFVEALPEIGDWVIAVGNPFGLGGTVTAGIVSAHGRDVTKDAYEDLVQIDAPINKGNSGGPSLDGLGRVVGVNTMIYSPSGGSVGIAFAIPASKVRNVVAQLRDKGTVTRGSIGVQFQTVSPAIAESIGAGIGLRTGGVLVADVRPSGPAAEAGLTVGDFVSSVGGDPVGDAHQFAEMIERAVPGTSVTLGVITNGAERIVSVTVSTEPAKPARWHDQAKFETRDATQLGLDLMSAKVRSGDDARGAIVIGVDAVGLAAGRGIEVGDVILDVAGQPIANSEDVYRLVREAQKAGKRSLLMRIRSGEKAQFIAMPIA